MTIAIATTLNRGRRAAPLLAAFLAGAWVQLAAPPRAAASTSITVDVMIVHALNDGSGVDAKLRGMSALSKPPLSAYNSFKVLTSTSMTLGLAKQSMLKLPSGRDVSVTYKALIDAARAGDAALYDIATTIQKAAGNTFVPLAEVNAKAGEWFFVNCQAYNGGSLYLALKVKP